MEKKQSFCLEKIIKRDGRVVDFTLEKISEAINKAATVVGIPNQALAEELAQEVVVRIAQQFPRKTPTVENVQDIVEETLIDKGQAKVAKAYILYRHKKEEERNRNALILGDHADSLDFSPQALHILERRYLLKNSDGTTTENPLQMLHRVAENVAKADLLYGSRSVSKTTEEFYALMATLRFLPNSPTLMNAGSQIQQLSSCFVLPITDSMEGIFGTLRDAAVIHQRGSGTGFSFSRLRACGDPVGKNIGVAAGPVAFMHVYDKALEAIRQGGIRPGANMAVLRVDHPDIIRFIESKRDKRSLKNFNISVAVTDRFMRAVETDRDYFIMNPRTNKLKGKLRARDVFALITQNAWKTGDPGLIFIDEINRRHPVSHLGEIETTNQCGEAPLLPHEGCALGSINLNKFFDPAKKEIMWNDLQQTIHTAVHFLDNVIDVNEYPLPEIAEKTKLTRKFGLGIMGFADLLLKLGVKYDSEEGLAIARTLMAFIKNNAYEKSTKLAEERGVFPAWKNSDHHTAGRKMRNATCISIAPTGTISILADASPGCEPLFAISYQKTVLGDTDLVYLNKIFERVAKERGFYSPELIRKIVRSGSIQQCKEIPKDVRSLFVTAQDIDPIWHIKMQATLQEHVDNSISKTINFPSTTSIKDVEEAYLLAWKHKCKGITIYRDGSYEDQVINIGDGL